jgi:hypothetical protein
LRKVEEHISIGEANDFDVAPFFELFQEVFLFDAQPGI